MWCPVPIELNRWRWQPEEHRADGSKFLAVPEGDHMKFITDERTPAALLARSRLPDTLAV
jgi:hypothetical protein